MDYLEFIFKKTDGALLLRLEQSAKIIGLSLKTFRNQLSQGSFPVPTIKVGRARMVRAVDLAEFLRTGVSPVLQAEKPSCTKNRGPGRPRKYAPRVQIGGAA